jgi:hypothetical protein
MKKIYTLFLTLLGFSMVSNAQSIIPASDELLLPQYAYYGGTTASHRVPFFCRLKISGLTPGATYRYFTGMSSNASATTQTPGNMYRINNGVSGNGFGHITGYTANKAINSSEINNDEMQTAFTSGASRHGRFTADGSGTYTGWFASGPVGNAAQQAIGANVHFYVQVNDGGSGTTLAQSFRTTSTIKLLNYTDVPSDPNGCTPLLGTSTTGDEKIVVIYDNTAGTGRPLYCTFTENNNQGGQLNEGNIWNNPVIYPTVDGVSGSWAAIIPNNLSGGVKAINFLNIPDASPILTEPNISNDGIWNGVSTVNPAGDSTKPIVINSIAGGSLPVNLLSFRGQSAKEGIRLFWETAQEVNNKKFEINRATSEGSNFRTIGTVDAVSMQSSINRYQFVDPNPVSGVNYYQLRQVDADGRSKTYKTIAVKYGEAINAMRLVQTGGGEMLVAITVSENKKGTILYTDMMGAVLYNQSVSLQEGENLVRIPVADRGLKMAVVSFMANEGERMNLKILR